MPFVGLVGGPCEFGTCPFLCALLSLEQTPTSKPEACKLETHLQLCRVSNVRSAARTPLLPGNADDAHGLGGVQVSDLARALEAERCHLLLVVRDGDDSSLDRSGHELVHLDLQTLDERRALGCGDLAEELNGLGMDKSRLFQLFVSIPPPCDLPHLALVLNPRRARKVHALGRPQRHPRGDHGPGGSKV